MSAAEGGYSDLPQAAPRFAGGDHPVLYMIPSSTRASEGFILLGADNPPPPGRMMEDCSRSRARQIEGGRCRLPVGDHVGDSAACRSGPALSDCGARPPRAAGQGWCGAFDPNIRAGSLGERRGTMGPRRPRSPPRAGTASLVPARSRDGRGRGLRRMKGARFRNG